MPFLRWGFGDATKLLHKIVNSTIVRLSLRDLLFLIRQLFQFNQVMMRKLYIYLETILFGVLKFLNNRRVVSSVNLMKNQTIWVFLRRRQIFSVLGFSLIIIHILAFLTLELLTVLRLK
jgi:hypothetical protein